MKQCHACGAYVEDDARSCPECGATIVTGGSGLTLKEDKDAKRKIPSHSTGHTVGQGTGLTSLLDNSDEYADLESDAYGGGSLPVSMSKNQLKEYEAAKRHERQRKGAGAIGTVVKILVLAAIAFGVYYLFVNVLLKTDGLESPEAVMDEFVAAVNEKDTEKLKAILPPYLITNLGTAENYLNSLSEAHIDKYDILEKKEISKSEIDQLEDTIKMSQGKTTTIKEAFDIRMRVNGTMKNKQGNKVNKFPEVTFRFINVKGAWYLYDQMMELKDYTND